jgi:hypothetical protein
MEVASAATAADGTFSSRSFPPAALFAQKPIVPDRFAGAGLRRQHAAAARISEMPGAWTRYLAVAGDDVTGLVVTLHPSIKVSGALSFAAGPVRLRNRYGR